MINKKKSNYKIDKMIKSIDQVIKKDTKLYKEYQKYRREKNKVAKILFNMTERTSKINQDWTLEQSLKRFNI